MSPPKLTGNAPVPDILHPVKVVLVKTLRHKLDLSAAHHVNSRLCKLLHLHKPLEGYSRLYGGAAPVAGAYVVSMRLHLNQIASCLQVCHNGFPGFIPIHTRILGVIRNNLGIIGHHIDYRQIMPSAHLKVVGVMGRCDLYNAGTKFHIHIAVCNHRDFSANQRQNHGLAHILLVAFILRVHCHCRITQQGLRTGGGKLQITAAVRKRIPQVPEEAVLLLKFHLCIGNGSVAVRAPVDDPFSPVDQTFFIIPDEHLPDSPVAALVHGKTLPLPVAGGAQLLELLYDSAAVLLLPCPGTL